YHRVYCYLFLHLHHISSFFTTRPTKQSPTLFPYTTLFRSEYDKRCQQCRTVKDDRHTTEKDAEPINDQDRCPVRISHVHQLIVNMFPVRRCDTLLIDRSAYNGDGRIENRYRNDNDGDDETEKGNILK